MAGHDAAPRRHDRNETPADAGTSLISGKAAAGPFAAVTVLFFFWRFITVMNDVLIPFLKSSFELSYFQAGLVPFAFLGAIVGVSLIYFALSVTSGGRSDVIEAPGETLHTAGPLCGWS